MKDDEESVLSDEEKAKIVRKLFDAADNLNASKSKGDASPVSQALDMAYFVEKLTSELEVEDPDFLKVLDRAINYLNQKLEENDRS